jgi:hypothetical protein
MVFNKQINLKRISFIFLAACKVFKHEVESLSPEAIPPTTTNFTSRVDATSRYGR